MRIGIIDADLLYRKRHRFPNLACMKLSAYWKEQGFETELLLDYSQAGEYDRLYVSKVFTDTFVPEHILTRETKDYPHIRKIQFSLDNDLPGRQAAKKLARKYTLMEYEVFVRLPPMGKDYNAFLQYKKENQELSILVEKERPLLTETKGTNIQKIEKMAGHRNIVPYQIAQAR